MSIALLFSILMIAWLILILVFRRPAAGASFAPLGMELLVFALILILGWQLFGPLIHR